MAAANHHDRKCKQPNYRPRKQEDIDEKKLQTSKELSKEDIKADSSESLPGSGGSRAEIEAVKPEEMKSDQLQKETSSARLTTTAK